MAYSQTDVNNQQVVVAQAKIAVINAQAAYNAAQAHLQVIQSTIALQNAQAAATPAPASS